MRARHTALLLPALLLGLSTAPARAAGTHRAMVLREFAHLDDEFKKAITRADHDRNVAGAITRIERDKLKIIDQEMAAPILGVPGNQWFRKLECVDAEIFLAQDTHSERITPGGAHVVIGDLEQALRCANALASALQAEGAPPDAVAAVGAIASKIDGYVKQASDAKEYKRLVIKEGAINLAKYDLAKKYMTALIDGVAGFDWYLELELTDIRLLTASLIEQGRIDEGPSAGRAVGSELAYAQFDKQRLEQEIKDAPPPPPVTFGVADIAAQAKSLVGALVADVEYFWRRVKNLFGGRAAAHPAQAPSGFQGTVPYDGTITEIKVHGYAISGDRPGPGGSEPIRFSVARPQPDGTLKVITTTNPPFTLPGSDGIWTFPMSQVSFPCCRVKRGDVISLDARGGEFAIFASVPGAITDTFSMTGPTQDPGYVWTPTDHPDVELLMQVTEQPAY